MNSDRGQKSSQSEPASRIVNRRGFSQESAVERIALPWKAGLTTARADRNPGLELALRDQRKANSNREPLWLCVFLPGLALEAVDMAKADSSVAVIEERQGRSFIYALSMQAQAQGLATGMPLADAYALHPALSVKPRSPDQEKQILNELATRALAFSSWVSLNFASALMLEAQGSMRLFGCLDALTQKLKEMLSESGHQTCCAVTPSPLASWLLARSGLERRVYHKEELRSILGDLPREVLDIGASTHRRLAQAGIFQLRDLWRLPRDGLARRYGTHLLVLLDQALGKRAMPLSHFHSPPCFRSGLELPRETIRLGDFFPAIEQLVSRLVTFLNEKGAALLQLQLQLTHNKAAPTLVHTGSRRPTRDGTHLTNLLRLRLERLSLPAAVSAVELTAINIVPWLPGNGDLFASQGDDPAEWQQLIEQLQARLGSSALRRLQIKADHRPELATGRTTKLIDPIVTPPLRPLWLLRQPCRLSGGELCTLLPGAERIESGWWDGGMVRRDYYRAIDRRGSMLWIYRDLYTPGQWYLHGLFG